MLLITVALLVVFGFALNGFAAVSNVINLLRGISILGILGLGMGLIVISRGINLREVAIMAGSWVIALIEMQQGMSVTAAVLLSLLLCVMIGIIVAFIECACAVRHSRCKLRHLWPRLLVRAGLGCLDAKGRLWTDAPRRRPRVRNSCPHPGVRDCGYRDASLSVAHLDWSILSMRRSTIRKPRGSPELRCGR